MRVAEFGSRSETEFGAIRRQSQHRLAVNSTMNNLKPIALALAVLVAATAHAQQLGRALPG